MKVAVIGSRTIDHADISRYIPPDTDMIISGGANGIDRLAEKYADKKGIKKKIIYPDYELYGKDAPLIRNKLIVDSADFIVAIWDGKSSGTAYTVSYARRRNIPIEVYILQAR